MNKRIKKKKYNKWETARVYNITVSFEDVPFVFDAFEAKLGKNLNNDPLDIYDEAFRRFATSRNVMRAVRSYCKKHVWNTGKCDNINDMYRYMCEEIHADREYRKRIAEQQERERQAFAAEWFRDADCPDMEHAIEMFVDLYNDINR